MNDKNELDDLDKEVLAKLQQHLNHIDESALVILKGHLVIEDALSEIIATFVFHSELLEGARLTFSQKVAIARSISLEEHNNEIWQLVLAINNLRNELAHALDSPKRVRKTHSLICLYNKLRGFTNAADGSEVPEHVQLSFTVSYSLGFIVGLLKEVRRSRPASDDADKNLNPLIITSDG